MASGDTLGAFSGLAEAAYIESIAAAAIIPAVWPIVAIMYEGQSDPQQIWLAADGWKDMIDELQKAQDKIEDLSRRVGEDAWKGDDRTAFDGKMHDYVNQIDFGIALAWTVTAILYVIAVLISIFIMLMFCIAGILAIFAFAICVAAGTIIGAPAAAEMEAEANLFAEGCLTVMEAAEKVLKVTFWGCAGAFGLLLGIDIGGQAWKGNESAVSNLAQATMNGADEMLKGTLSYLEQKATSNSMKGKNITIWGRRSFFGKEIPDIPLGGQKAGGVKGLIDVFGGGPTLSNLVPGGDAYGTEDTDHNNRPDGDDYVDRTQPHR
jgi:uncharacterized membrane protein